MTVDRPGTGGVAVLAGSVCAMSALKTIIDASVTFVQSLRDPARRPAFCKWARCGDAVFFTHPAQYLRPSLPCIEVVCLDRVGASLSA
jgi:hypothetical protein